MKQWFTRLVLAAAVAGCASIVGAGQAKTDATGRARLEAALHAGRAIDSQRAVYHVKMKVIEMFGEPVTMLDRQKNVIHGRHMIYHTEGGRVDILGDANATVPGTKPGDSGGGSAKP